MRKQKASDQFMRAFKAEIVDRTASLLSGQSNDNTGQQVEDESGVDFNHDAVLGAGNDVFEREDILDEVEEDLNLPTLSIELIDERRGETGLKDVGDIKAPLILVNSTLSISERSMQ